MLSLFVLSLSALILADFIKGLSANGTPPVLQKFSWQMDLAYFTWNNILTARIVLVVLAGFFAWQAWSDAALAIVLVAIVLGALWYGVFWLFNRFWVGKYKFLPISRKDFVGAEDNKVDLSLQVIGVAGEGEQKAFPVNMLFYHHQITDDIAGAPIWVTYCGLCRSGRVYDIAVDGKSLDFSLVGAITFNAVFRDNQTGSWWRQETGEAAKGPMQGRQLEDVPFEQMSLGQWLAKHPSSKILQYDPTFQGKYNFLAKLLNYEASLPGWHRQETPPLVIGVEIGQAIRAYDFEQLQKRRLVSDQLGDSEILVLSDESGSSAFVYDRSVDGHGLEFELDGDGLRDTNTGSSWDQFGKCYAGKLQGSELRQIQSYQQFLRAWISFHPGTSFYNF